MIVVAAPAPMMLVLVAVISRSPIELSPLKPSPLPLMVSWYVPAGTRMVVPGLRLANATAPRRLQSLAAAVQAEAAGLSSVLSTVILARGGAIATVSRLAEREEPVDDRMLTR